MQFQAAAATLDPASRDFYQSAVRYLQEGSIPFLVGGAYSFARFTGLERHTKDFDVFVAKDDCESALTAFEKAGYATERVFPHWLAKAFRSKSDDFVDAGPPYSSRSKSHA